MINRLMMLVFALTLQALPAAEAEVKELVSYRHPELGMVVIRARLGGLSREWQATPAEAQGLRQVYLSPMHERVPTGRRMRAYLLQERLASPLWTLRWLRREMAEYAGTHQDTGPRTIAELSSEWVRKHFQNIPDFYPKQAAGEAPSPCYFVVPEANFKDPRQVILIELRPYVNDGKHYVVRVSGAIERQPIDKTLLKTYGVKVQPALQTAGLPVVKQDEEMTVLALLPPAVPDSVTLALTHSVTGEQVKVDLPVKQAAAGSEEIFQAWSRMRSRQWPRQAYLAPTSVWPIWLARHEELYGVKLQPPRRRFRWTTPGRRASVFNLLGGRSAIRETLQLDVLTTNEETATEQATIDISSLRGVQVKSHPFAQMLAGKEGGELRLANLVPHDRFMIYFARPQYLAAYLDRGAAGIFEGSSVATASALQYKLKDRYLKRLGLGSGWGKAFLESSAVQDLILYCPDLFFIDGTDVTLILRVPQLKLIAPLMAVAGIKGLEDGNLVVKDVGDGRSSYWAYREQLLMVSTNRRELAASLRLLAHEGEGSLGKSAEFRYMLTKLPVRRRTWGYAYFSDPFIRRLVGPEVKIGQLRRMRARSEMEALTAAALLHQYDGHAQAPSLDRLLTLGYADASWNSGEYRLGKDLQVSSATYGSATAMRSLPAVPIQSVTSEEAAAYKAYMENYSRFWRQFFDPIAIRLDELQPGQLELEIFILPLLDSSIYNIVRMILSRHGQGPKLALPNMTPEPVLSVSANVSEAGWIQFTENLGEITRELGLHSAILDELGPSLHFAIMDADPVINLGSGDIFGAMSSGSILGGGQEEMLLIPFALSVLTRPCKLAVQLKNPDRVARLLAASGGGVYGADDDVSLEFARVRDESNWVCTVDVMGLLKLRFGVEIKNGFLIISNVPWADTESLELAAGVLDSAALQVNPAAGKQQLPGLYAAAVDRERLATFNSAAHLQPLLLAGSESPKIAAERHQKLFGFRPALAAADDQWSVAEGELESRRYGTPDNPLQPQYEPGNRDFGMLRQLRKLLVSMQLEDDGLRTRLRWTLRQPEEPKPPQDGSRHPGEEK